MRITNATLAKKAVIDLLKAAAVPAGLLDGVDVHYAFHGDVGFKSIYGGGWRLQQENAVAEAPGVLVRELVSFSLYVRVVARPPVDVEVTDADADAVGGAIGAIFKANPKPAGPFSIVGLVSGQGDYSCTGDETISVHGYQVQVASNLSWG